MSLAALIAKAKAEREAQAAKPVAQVVAEVKQEVAAQLGTGLTGFAAILAKKKLEAEAKHAVAALPDGASEAEVAPLVEEVKQNAVAEALDEMRVPSVAESHNKTIAEVYGGIAPQVALDESQEAAVAGLVAEQFACLVGYAGTGKTTTLRAFVARLLDQIPAITIGSLAHLSESFNGHACRNIPAIAFAAFTGRAAKQMTNSLPDCFRPHCSTIHRLLGFKPEFYEAEQFDTSGRFLGMKK